ncbi:ab-hydrolase associated lipase region containing protein [Stylonychia lemnae]|uniref:Ab-hydrolase associated lipase region containing protein n=1 Tax=Stylonychia lemnae TaxID=5949 RepID=A0A078A7G2_STYLE|nr:ab-hydrolase associated lipase region containing protein [Stylonychia lemnae]|eukprot:CDW77487.1 ab-hydrolase associated lipase region containing protein [Stylonychia lemnae]
MSNTSLSNVNNHIDYEDDKTSNSDIKYKSCIDDGEQKEWESLKRYNKDDDKRSTLDVIFDSSNEYCKSFVREIFHISSQTIDGVCAAILHAIQSPHHDSYYVNRRNRLMSSDDRRKRTSQTPDQKSLRKDKLLEIYLSRSLLSQQSFDEYLSDNKETKQIENLSDLAGKKQDRISFTPDESRKQVEETKNQEQLAKYVKDYFKNYQIQNKQNERKRDIILKSVRKTIKSVLAVASFWVPDLFNLIQKRKNVIDPVKHIVISPDHLTNGFLEDSQLVIQLFFDQFFLTMRIAAKKGMNIFTFKSGEIADVRDNQGHSKKHKKKIFDVVRNSMIAFFSFTMHKFFINLPQLPMYIKQNVRYFLSYHLIQTANFMKDHIYKYYWPSLRLLGHNVDKRTINQMITKSGYSNSNYEVETEDGYIINMNRIVNSDAFKVVYFQHGVLDNSFTWVVHGPSDSIAYQSHEEGYDVFLGNFRGIYPRRLAAWKDPKTYWNYNIDHYAKYDIPAFLEKIHKIKHQELREKFYQKTDMTDDEITKDIDSKLTITYIGHSLGGMTLPMYVIHQKLRNRPHYLNKAILLSPAGIHSQIPLIVKTFGWIFCNIVPKFIDHLALPNVVIDCANKIHKDIKSLPASNDLVSYLTSKIMGGNGIGDTPIGKSAKLLTSMLLFGFPMELVDHFYYSLYKENKFQAYNYRDKKKNQLAYGSDKPLNYLENYHLIDIDIHYFISMNDFLIRADDIIEHYNALKHHSPELAHLKVFEGYSHIDFTYQSHHSMIAEIIHTLKGENTDSSQQEVLLDQIKKNIKKMD